MIDQLMTPNAQKLLFVICVIVTVAALSGCGSMAAYEAVASDAGEKAATHQWTITEAAYCRGNTTGALLRMPREQAQRFQDYCREVMQ